ncbi:WGR domain-containing protein (plasmid) [Bradyrhizobium sp. 186]|uniref:WGR domain-containing protein n=1 Tax=Bradyrhizobium sp. 186 TaxID=2782654 RepID=UPI00206B9934|nr:WGR domain-containing protein [Bradyrhizobium sp. 186]
MSELTVQYVVLERCDPARNMARFYVLTIESTLFGDTALVREWGRLGQRGRRRLDLFAGRVQAVEALEAWLVRKARRGYVRRNSTASMNHPVHRDIARLEERQQPDEASQNISAILVACSIRSRPICPAGCNGAMNTA